MIDKKMKKFNNSEIVTIAIYNLGGEAEAIDIEDIAITSYDIDPSRFSWKKYPDRIDLRVVQDALKDLKKKDPQIINGSIRHGYILTKIGIDFAKKNPLPDILVEAAPRQKSSEVALEKEKVRLQLTTAYKKFIKGQQKEITKLELQEFARVNDYFAPHLKEQRYSIIDNVVEDEKELKKLWKYVKKSLEKGK